MIQPSTESAHKPAAATPQPSLLAKLAIAQARIDERYDLELVEFYCDAAREQAERYTGIALRCQIRTERVTLDGANQAIVRETPLRISRATLSVRGDLAPYNDAVLDVYGFIPYNGFGAPALAPLIELPTRAAFNGPLLTFTPGIPGAVADVEYHVGPMSEAELRAKYPGIVMGMLKYVTHAYENRGDSNMSDFAKSSGALSHWRPYQRIAS